MLAVVLHARCRVHITTCINMYNAFRRNLSDLPRAAFVLAKLPLGVENQFKIWTLRPVKMYVGKPSPFMIYL